jgi:hypothetical protein
MNFNSWIFLEDMKQLAKAYSSLLKDVPQDPEHHPEGNVLKHVKLVRKAIPRAIEELKALKEQEPFASIFSKINFDVSSKEMDILVLSVWLHDIGKASATTINPKTGKLTARGHQDPEHYLPQIEGLLNITPELTKEFYFQNKELIHFLIERHMDLSMGGFSNKFLKQYYEKGVLKNLTEIKLLLILMWADKMGRTPEAIIGGLEKNKDKIIFSTKRSIDQELKTTKQTKQPFEGSPQKMIDMLKEKGISGEQLFAAAKGKFPSLSDEEISRLI